MIIHITLGKIVPSFIIGELISLGLAAIINLDDDEEIIFGDERSVDEIVWMGFDETLADKAKKVGAKKVKPFSKLQ